MGIAPKCNAVFLTFLTKLNQNLNNCTQKYMSFNTLFYIKIYTIENQRFRFTINDELLRFMERNCCNHLSIQEIATKCGYSAEHFSRMFKKVEGTSPGEYRKRWRA